MGTSTPDRRYYKDGNGLRPTWRLWFRHPWHAAWLSAPKWYVKWRCRRNDRLRVR